MNADAESGLEPTAPRAAPTKHDDLHSECATGLHNTPVRRETLLTDCSPLTPELIPDETSNGLKLDDGQSLVCPRLRSKVVGGQQVHECVVEQLCPKSTLALQDLSTRGQTRLDGSCLIIFPRAGEDSEIVLRNLSFEGGMVVVAGAYTKARFINTRFFHCCLVATNGASAILESCRLSGSREVDCNMGCGRGVCIYAAGVGSTVHVQSGSISGGLRGAVVTSGASFAAENVTMTGNEWVAVEAQGSRTSVKLTGCMLSGNTLFETENNMSTHPVESGSRFESIGVLASAGSSCRVTDSNVQGFKSGFMACECHLHLLRTSVEAFLRTGCWLRGVLSANLTDSNFSQCSSTGDGNVTGLLVTAGPPCPDDPSATFSDTTSKVVTGTNCIFLASHGVAVKASGNVYVELFDCRAEQSCNGLEILSGASLIAKGCSVNHNTHGVTVSSATLLAETLIIEHCTDSGARVSGQYTETLFEDCSILNNGGVSIRAEDCSILTLRGCYIGWQGSSPTWHIDAHPTEGLYVCSGAYVKAECTEIIGAERFGVFVHDQASRAMLQDCLVQVCSAEAVPVAASLHGSITVVRSTVHGGRCGMHIREHASAVLDRCFVTQANREACIVCLGSRLQLLTCHISSCGAGLVAMNPRSSVFGFGGSISDCGGSAVRCSNGAHVDMHELASYRNVAGFEASKGGCMHLNSCSSCDVFLPFNALDLGNLQCVNCMAPSEVWPGMWY